MAAFRFLLLLATGHGEGHIILYHWISHQLLHLSILLLNWLPNVRHDRYRSMDGVFGVLLEVEDWFYIFNRFWLLFLHFFFLTNFILTERCRALSLEWRSATICCNSWLTLLIFLLISKHWHQIIAWITRSCLDSCYKLHNWADLSLTFICMERTNCRLFFWLYRIVRVSHLVIVAYVVFLLTLTFWFKFNFICHMVWEIVYTMRTCRRLHGSGHKSWNWKPICVFRWCFRLTNCFRGILQ